MNKFVLLRPLKEATKTKGGLLLSEEDKKDIGVEKAEIINIGPLCSDAVQVGDMAIYDSRMVNSVDVDGEIFRVLLEDHIILIQRGV